MDILVGNTKEVHIVLFTRSFRVINLTGNSFVFVAANSMQDQLLGGSMYPSTDYIHTTPTGIPGPIAGMNFVTREPYEIFRKLLCYVN